MSLKKSIVIVNQFTIKSSDGRGSRGASPGDYVTRYMAREKATEPVAPIRKREMDGYITRYMSRESAVESFSAHRRGDGGVRELVRPTLKARRRLRSAARAGRRNASRGRRFEGEDLKQAFRADRGLGGVSFGYGEVSLSDEGLRMASDDIQAHFDAGHTVFKTVLSFDHEYLESTGLVPPGMTEIRRGDYRGQLDQMKLRMAIMHGLDRMAAVEGFDDLRYVGVIQVDTEHVHAHLAMVDAGRGRLAGDGTQRGKINAREKARLRRGIDAWLDEHQVVKHMSSAVGYERRNVVSWVKRWAYEAMSVQNTAQHLLACLPDDKRLWRASTNVRSMRKPNRLVHDLVERHLSRPGSPLPQAMAEVTAYANERTRREDLSDAERQKLIDAGRARIIENCVNGVYSVLKTVPEVEREVRTPMMETMSMDFEELYSAMTASVSRRITEDPSFAELVSGAGRPDRDRDGADGMEDDESPGAKAEAGQFVFRLRSYTARMEHHRRMRARYAADVAEWEASYARGLATEDSRAIRDFYSGEEGYHARAAAKYQHLLAPGGVKPEWMTQWAAIDDYGHRVIGLKAMRGDVSLQRMKDPEEAEKLGREIYGQAGAGQMCLPGAEGAAGKAKLDSRIAAMERTYASMVEEVRRQWSTEAAHLELAGVDEEVVDMGGRRTHRMVLSENSEHVAAVYGDAVDEVGQPGQPDEPRVSIYSPGVAVAVSTRPEYDFESVRGVDIHDMGHDWVQDQRVGRKVAARYAQLALDRRQRLEYARAWLEFTGQGDKIDEVLGVAESDVSRMEAMVVQLSETSTLPSKIAEAAREADLRERRRRERAARAARARRELAGEMAGMEESQLSLDPVTRSGRTVRLDSTLGADINRMVDDAVFSEVGRLSQQGRDLGS